MPIHVGCLPRSPGLLPPGSFPALLERARGVKQWPTCRALLMPILLRQRGKTLKGATRITDLQMRPAVLPMVKWIRKASLTSALQRLCHGRRQAGLGYRGDGKRCR